MRSRRQIGVLVGIAAAVAILGVALGQNRGVRALWLGDAGFEADLEDGRIFLEPGVDRDAVTQIRNVLDMAIADVEAAHGRPFAGDVKVFLCARQDSFNERTAADPLGVARGAVFADRLFLSPLVFSTRTYTGILTHELSHLHFRQIMGTAYTTTIPGWFQEGMAVFVAHGGGAEPVSGAAAWESMRRGNRLSPEDVGAARPRFGGAHGLQHHMFYRQSELFVADLAERRSTGFDHFLDLLFDGVPFRAAFDDAFGGSVSETWTDFVATGVDAPPGDPLHGT